MTSTTPPPDPVAETRFECHRANGYDVNPGIYVHERCPYCGHRVLDDDGHEVVVDVRG